MKLIKKLLYTILNCLNFFLSLKKKDNLLVTLPRSGTHLTLAMLNICYSMQKGHGKNFSAIEPDKVKSITQGLLNFCLDGDELVSKKIFRKLKV